MFKVITRNSVYTVTAVGNGFHVTRSADMWGREVSENHAHTTPSLRLGVGERMITSAMRTSPVLAIIGAE